MSDKAIGSWVYVLRVLTVICGLGLIFLGIYELANFDFDELREFFLWIYYILFGIIVCLIEMPFERLMSWFYFLKFYFGKGVFFLFLGSITFDWDPYYYLIISLVFFCTGVMYLILSFTVENDFTKYAEKEYLDQDKSHYEGV